MLKHQKHYIHWSGSVSFKKERSAGSQNWSQRESWPLLPLSYPASVHGSCSFLAGSLKIWSYTPCALSKPYRWILSDKYFISYQSLLRTSTCEAEGMSSISLSYTRKESCIYIFQFIFLYSMTSDSIPTRNDRIDGKESNVYLWLCLYIFALVMILYVIRTLLQLKRNNQW